MAITRRNFLRRSAITAVGLSFASPLLQTSAFGSLRQGRGGSKLNLSNKVIVAVNLFGGNDGMNTVIPMNQYSRYYQLRPTIHIPTDRTLVLPNAPDYAFNPGMTALHALYGQGKVAVINGVGAPPDAYGLFDHEASQYMFQSSDITGSASATVPSGWIGRYLDNVQEGIVTPGVNLGGGELLLRGVEREALSIGSIDQFQVQPGFDGEARIAAYNDIMAVPASAGGVAERNRMLRESAIEQSAIVRERTAGYTPSVEYPADNYLGDSLRQCAQLLSADLGVRALGVGYDGYDTHASQEDGANETQLGYHSVLMKDVSDAIGAFQADLVGHGLAQDVILLVFSEFGRRPEENNDAGTDHGYGSVGFVVGETVHGGVYGEYPNLNEDRLVLDGNVDVTTDFRSVYAEVLGEFIGIDPVPVLGGTFPALGFL